MEVVVVKEEPMDPDEEHISPDLVHIDDKPYCCRVCNMILKDFSQYSANEQAKILEEGRPKPKMGTMIFYTQKGLRKCFNVKRFETHEWLTGCKGSGKLFCWPCLLFSKKDGPCAKNEFSEAPELTNVLRKHMKSQRHIDAMVKWKTIGKVHPSFDGDDEPLDHGKCNDWLADEMMMNNRRILKRLIRVFCFLSVHELCSPLVVGEEPTDPIDQNKYEQFLSFIGKYDDFLEKQLASESYHKQFLSPTVRRQIISSISEVVTTEIVREVSQANFVSIIVDEVAEMGNANLVSTIVRYVGANGEPRERFLNFIKIPTGRKADLLFQVINRNVALLECPSKVVSISCDGGIVNVHEITKLQILVKKLLPNVCFLHYCGHKLISVLAQSLSTIQLCKSFFSTLNGLAMSFIKSKKLSDELNLIIKKNKTKAKDFKWCFDGHLINNVNGIRQDLIKLFQRVLKNKNDWDFETVMASSKFLPILANDIPFNFLLLLLKDIFVKADPLSSLLAVTNLSVDLCMKFVNDLRDVIKNKNKFFSWLYGRVVRRCAVGPHRTRFVYLRQNKKIRESCKRLCENVIMNLLLQLNSRFSDLAITTFLSATDLRCSNSPVLTHLPKHFGHFFDTEVLQAELKILWQSSEFKKCEPWHILKQMRLKNFDATLFTTPYLYELFLALPLIKADSSTLERIDRYIQTSSLPHRLSPLAILNIEKELVGELSEDQKFNEDVIRVFFRERNPHIRDFFRERNPHTALH